MLVRSIAALSLLSLSGAAFAACGAYPERNFPSTSSSGASGSTGTSSSGAGGVGGAGTGGSSGNPSDAAGGTGGMVVTDASVSDAKADGTTADVKVDTGPPDPRCADGTVEQVFGPKMVGCADKAAGTTWIQRDQLCGTNCKACVPMQWVVNRNATRPTYNYWTDENLQLTPNSPMTSAMCGVTKWAGAAGGEGPCAGQPMRICATSADPGPVTDPVGSKCDIHDCAFEEPNSATSPNHYFGGCASGRTAGTLCCCQ